MRILITYFKAYYAAFLICTFKQLLCFVHSIVSKMFYECVACFLAKYCTKMIGRQIVNSSLASKIRYSYLIFFIPAVMFMVFAFTSIYYANARYNDIIQSAVVASKFGLEFKDDFDYETYLLIVGNKSPEETTLHNKIYDASKILDRLEELAVSDESMDRLASLRKYLDNLENYTNRIIENLHSQPD